MPNEVATARAARKKLAPGIHETEILVVPEGTSVFVFKSDADLMTMKSRSVVISAAVFISQDNGATWQNVGAFCHVSGNENFNNQFEQVIHLVAPTPKGTLAKGMFACFTAGPDLGMTLEVV